ncbi:hypothetical protein C7M84_002362 [Penaeus vannamei]|uniref:Uncharacterized protein n=1 Tax=Penaeus vannamei TaxID=6689 RepID=A0A3R7MDG1_PENVA|nr:hypothetical protein C7M84_002362 [Penaeus vannamei]
MNQPAGRPPTSGRRGPPMARGSSSHARVGVARLRDMACEFLPQGFRSSDILKPPDPSRTGLTPREDHDINLTDTGWFHDHELTDTSIPDFHDGHTRAGSAPEADELLAGGADLAAEESLSAPIFLTISCPYSTHAESIEEVKHEYRKGSRSFEHSVSRVPPVHVYGDDLYKDAPPHGFITAKYEAAHHPPPPVPPLQRPVAFTQPTESVPEPLPPLIVHDTPLPPHLPSLEDEDPLIFDPILPYNDYFDAAIEAEEAQTSTVPPSPRLPVTSLSTTAAATASTIPSAPTTTTEFPEVLDLPTSMSTAQEPLVTTTVITEILTTLPVSVDTTPTPLITQETPVTLSTLSSVTFSPSLANSSPPTEDFRVSELEIQELPSRVPINSLPESNSREPLDPKTFPTATKPTLRLRSPPTAAATSSPVPLPPTTFDSILTTNTPDVHSEETEDQLPVTKDPHLSSETNFAANPTRATSRDELQKLRVTGTSQEQGTPASMYNSAQSYPMPPPGMYGSPPSRGTMYRQAHRGLARGSTSPRWVRRRTRTRKRNIPGDFQL